ncbi:MAG: glycosyltransferase family 4 protein, partial [Sulfolobales archaeon]
LTVSRYSSEKNLESIIRVASLCREYEFIICGSTSGEVSKRYIERLENLIDSLRLDNIILRRDCPRSDVERLYREAKIYLHPVYPEHFGIAIAEAMSFGVVPLVFRDGGAYTDLVPDESYGYSEVNEACSKIRGLIRDRDLWLRMSVRAWERSRYFSYDSFRDKITRIVRYVYALKLRDSEIIRSTDLLL